MSRAEVRSLIRDMADLLSKRDFATIDEKLASIDLTADAVLIMGLVRSSAVAKDYLKNWVSTSQKVYDELVRRGENADGIMVGLPYTKIIQ